MYSIQENHPHNEYRWKRRLKSNKWSRASDFLECFQNTHLRIVLVVIFLHWYKMVLQKCFFINLRMNFFTWHNVSSTIILLTRAVSCNTLSAVSPSWTSSLSVSSDISDTDSCWSPLHKSLITSRKNVSSASSALFELSIWFSLSFSVPSVSVVALAEDEASPNSSSVCDSHEDPKLGTFLLCVVLQLLNKV